MINNKKIKYILLFISGSAAGFLSGLLGAGGGMIALLAINLLYPDTDTRGRFAMTICAMLPVTIISAIVYILKNNINFSIAGPFLIPAAIGGLTGAFALGKLPIKFIKIILALILLLSGILMVLGT